MAKLTTNQRKKLKAKTFGLPSERKYPMPDKSHAANAKARATQQVKEGNLSKSEKEKIDMKANKILGKKKVASKPKPKPKPKPKVKVKVKAKAKAKRKSAAKKRAY